MCDICEINKMINMFKLLEVGEIERLLNYPEGTRNELLTLMVIEFEEIINRNFNGIVPDNLEDFKGFFEFNVELIVAS